MTGAVLVWRGEDAPCVDRAEILRYMGTQADPAAQQLIETCLTEATPHLSFQVCYARFPIAFREGEIDLGFAVTASNDLKKNLEGCNEIIVFAATVGSGIDRLIARWERISPAKALCLHAMGAERVEALCDQFNQAVKKEFAREGRALRPRFSPGYGDLPLELQRDIFRVLDCPRKIGLTLNESLLMSPSKSVTAIIGVIK